MKNSTTNHCTFPPQIVVNSLHNHKKLHPFLIEIKVVFSHPPSLTVLAEYVDEYALAAEIGDIEALEPCSLAEAKKRPDWHLWEKAIQEELAMLKTSGTWELVDAPEDANIVGSKWVFRAKKDAAGNVVQYKARLVAQGFSQVPGVDYFDTFAPV